VRYRYSESAAIEGSIGHVSRNSDTIHMTDPTTPILFASLRPRLVLFTCCLSLFLVTMDITIVNLALPAIGRDLHASVTGLQWAIDGYTVVIASFLVVAGSTADRLGRRRVFQLGIVVFTTGSLLCSTAPTIELLVAFRVVQALGGSMLNPVAMSILVNVFTEAGPRARAIGVWSSVVGLSMAVGPLLGGFLVQAIGWRAIFWINVPVGALALAMTRRFIPESRAERPRRPDLIGLALIVIGLAALTSSLIEARRLGWGSPLIAGGLGVAGVALLGLIGHERRRRDPLIELRCFRSAPFALASVLAVLGFATFNGGLFLSSLYLQLTRGLPAVRAGLCLLPIAAALLICAPISGRLVGAGRARWALVAAGLTQAAGALLLVGLDVATPVIQLLAAFALAGISNGLINAPITTSAVSGMPRAQAGVAAAIASTSRQTGTTLGVALSGTIAGVAANSPAFAIATRPYWWFVAAAGVVIAALGVAATTARARRSAQAVHAQFE
jgi:EmrB/QacA subfamily drug resistance transporter